MNATKRKGHSQKDLGNELPSLGYAEDDIRCQLVETARSGIQHILDILESQYRKDRGLNVLPESLWVPLRKNAYLHYARHCERLADDLRKAASRPSIKF